jgi:hypothetical protein
MKSGPALAAVLLCAGCATAPPSGPPAIEEEQWAMLTEPETPAPERPPASEETAAARCDVKPPAQPRWPLDDPALRGKDVAAKVQAALREIELRRAYEAKLEAALRACAQAAAGS